MRRSCAIGVTALMAMLASENDEPEGGQKGGGGRKARRELNLGAMQPLKAHVHNGRLVLDEPTDLPELARG